MAAGKLARRKETVPVGQRYVPVAVSCKVRNGVFFLISIYVGQELSAGSNAVAEYPLRRCVPEGPCRGLQ